MIGGWPIVVPNEEVQFRRSHKVMKARQALAFSNPGPPRDWDLLTAAEQRLLFLYTRSYLRHFFRKTHAAHLQRWCKVRNYVHGSRPSDLLLSVEVEV